MHMFQVSVGLRCNLRFAHRLHRTMAPVAQHLDARKRTPEAVPAEPNMVTALCSSQNLPGNCAECRYVAACDATLSHIARFAKATLIRVYMHQQL
jgi:hypothetical protein